MGLISSHRRDFSTSPLHKHKSDETLQCECIELEWSAAWQNIIEVEWALLLCADISDWKPWIRSKKKLEIMWNHVVARMYTTNIVCVLRYFCLSIVPSMSQMFSLSLFFYFTLVAIQYEFNCTREAESSTLMEKKRNSIHKERRMSM